MARSATSKILNDYADFGLMVTWSRSLGQHPGSLSAEYENQLVVGGRTCQTPRHTDPPRADLAMVLRSTSNFWKFLTTRLYKLLLDQRSGNVSCESAWVSSWYRLQARGRIHIPEGHLGK